MKAILSALGGTVLGTGMLLAQSDMPVRTEPADVNNMPARTSSNDNRTFTGLLVAKGCDTTAGSQSASSRNQPRGSANEMSEATMQSRTSAVGNEGNSTYEQSISQADRNRTGTNRTSSRISDPTMAKSSPRNESNTTYEQNIDQSDRNRVASSAAETTGRADRSMPNRTSEQDMNAGTPSDMNPSTADRSSENTNWARAQQIANQMPNSCRISSRTSTYALRLSDGRLVRFDDASNAKIQQQLQSSGRFSTHSTKIYRVVVKGTMQGDTISLDSIQI